MAVADGLRVTRVDQAASEVSVAYLLEPPGWTRLEPQSVSGDPTPGLEARLHDPLWLLTRQWQLGEFHGEDVGSPVLVHIASSTASIRGYRAGDSSAGHAAREWQPGDLLEPVAELEPGAARGTGLLQRATAGAQLLTELAPLHVDAAVAQMVADCPLGLSWEDARDVAGAGWLALFAGRLPDPEQVASAMALDTGTATAAPWFDALPDPAPVLSAVVDWHAWYRAGIAPLPEADADAWVADRLEYRFSVDVPSSAGLRVLRAPEFGGGRIEWHAMDHDDSASGGLLPDDPPTPTSATATLLATPLRFSGMPASRYWQFEDAQVNFGALQTQPHDLARLALAEFALVYGNDWLVVPLDAPYGSYVTVDALSCTTSFGEQVVVDPIDDSGRTGRFRLFATSSSGPTGSLPGLFLPPSAAVVSEGPPREEVLFLRDEMANLAWAVERSVEGPSGVSRSRTDEPKPAPDPSLTDPGADMDYLLQNEVPDWWIPLVPVSTGYGTIALRKGAMVKDGQPVLPLGVLLTPGQRLTVQDEEIPREGIRVRRVPALARRADGTYVRWTGRRSYVGRGEGASGLAFDSAIRRTAPSTD